MTETSLWKIAVDAPLPEALTYLHAPELPPLQRGQLVNVPLGKRVTKGLVLGPSTAALDPEIKLKAVASLDEEYPALPEHFIKWLEWLANYYIYPIGQVVQLTYPPLERKEKLRKSKRPPVIPDMKADTPPELTPEQRQTVDSIASFDKFSSHLVFGVTGSGKTEVYLHLLE